MTLTATARSIPGTLRQEVVIDGQHRLITDEPKRLGGDGSGPAPHELFPAALAACVSTTLVMYARSKGWELGSVRVAVEYDHRSTPRKFDVAIELGGELTDAQLERLERVARSCPLRRSLEAGIEFEETWASSTRRLPAARSSSPDEPERRFCNDHGAGRVEVHGRA
jgi:putative redox protein